MPAIHEIVAAVDGMAPFDTAEEWDNSGLLVNCGGDVSAVLVTLDITDEVVAEAEAAGCQLVIAHHPVIFHPLRSIAHGDIAYRLVQKGISALCAHTNLDSAAGGVNDILAAIFGIEKPVPFAGIGRVGPLRQPAGAGVLARTCADKFGAHVRLADAGKPVHTLAVLGGSGGGLLAEAVAAGAQCVLTGEADHHDALDALQAGVSLIAAGHFSTEFPVVPVLADRLAKIFPDTKFLVSRKNRDPFTHLAPEK